MSYQVILSRPAEHDLEHLPRDVQERALPVLRSLAADPRPSGAVAVKEVPGTYRIRVGSTRIVYAVRDKALVVLVLAMADRKEVYTRKEIARIRKTLQEWGRRH